MNHPVKALLPHLVTNEVPVHRFERESDSYPVTPNACLAMPTQRQKGRQTLISHAPPYPPHTDLCRLSPKTLLCLYDYLPRYGGF